jgi:hypothetical protein
MCACEETDVRESRIDSTFAGEERQGSRGETCYATFDETPIFFLPERGVLYCLQLRICFNISRETLKRFMDAFAAVNF